MIVDKSYRILVVDDVAIVRRTIIYMLEIGLDCTLVFVEAGDGEEALAEFQTSEFDLVISDLIMPKMNGLELVKRVRSVDPAVPILMITAHDEKVSAAEAIRAGVTDFMVKPFHQRMLVDTCAKCLTDFPANAPRQYPHVYPDRRRLLHAGGGSDAIQP